MAEPNQPITATRQYTTPLNIEGSRHIMDIMMITNLNDDMKRGSV